MYKGDGDEITRTEHNNCVPAPCGTCMICISVIVVPYNNMILVTTRPKMPNKIAARYEYNSAKRPSSNRKGRYAKVDHG
jgi:hypothetical protein